MTEQTFQNELMMYLSRDFASIRFWRQPAGVIPAKRGGAVKAAPNGAADITGIVRPEGWRVEIECKADGGRQSAAQRNWEQFIRASGGIYVLAVHDDEEDMATNCARVSIEIVEQLKRKRGAL